MAPAWESPAFDMKAILAVILALLPLGATQAALKINVVYPRKNQVIALVDSTFIFGSVKAGSRLYIDGQKIEVHKGGGWLAFANVSPGPYAFHLLAVNGPDTIELDWPIVVGSPEAAMPVSKYEPRSPLPAEKAMYFVGDEFEFSFEAPPGGQAWFIIDQRKPTLMYQSLLPRRKGPGSVFESTRATTADSSNDNSVYVGYHRFTAADTGVHTICYRYRNRAESAIENPVLHESCLDSLITVLPEYPPVSGLLVGQNHIIRTAPGAGYKLLYQPPGIPVSITGMRDRFYQIALADGITGYVNVDSVKILPPGTFVPEGVVSYITVDSIPGGTRVSADIGVMAPFEIEESLSPARLDISLYGVTSAVDWVRYNFKSPLLEVLKWSQDQDHVFKMSLELGEGQLWGFKAFYLENKFVLEIKERPKKKSWLAGRLNGLKIALDPGHSQDPGAVGPTGLREKDANLWIAHELRKMLESKGAEVLMTRYGHEHVALYDRPLKADQWGADLLISIHNNAHPDGVNPFYNDGTSVYYYHPHSEPLARAIHGHLLKRTGLLDHGLYYGNLVLTRYSAVPSVLVECTFMMIPEQEALLKTNKFQRKCAQAILEGIEDFLKGGE